MDSINHHNAAYLTLLEYICHHGRPAHSVVLVVARLGLGSGWQDWVWVAVLLCCVVLGLGYGLGWVRIRIRVRFIVRVRLWFRIGLPNVMKRYRMDIVPFHCSMGLFDHPIFQIRRCESEMCIFGKGGVSSWNQHITFFHVMYIVDCHP